jgi:hypothetical protein
VVHLQDALAGAVLRRVVRRVQLSKELLDTLRGFALRLQDLVLLLALGLLALECGACVGQPTLVRILGSASSGAPRLTLLR